MSNLQFNYKQYTLNNGLTVSLQNTDTQTIFVKVRVNSGAINEKLGEDGLAHFLEHVVMGGSKNYSLSEFEKLRDSAGSVRAVTSLEKTQYQLSILSDELPLYVGFISDWVFNPQFDELIIERERQRVLREISNRKSDSNAMAFFRCQDAFYGKSSEYSKVVLGNKSVIETIDSGMLKMFHNREYQCNNIDLFLVGNLPDNIEDLIEQNFGGFEKGVYEKYIIQSSPKLVGNKLIHEKTDDLLNNDNPNESSAELNMRLFAPNLSEKDSSAVNLMNVVLGGYIKSRLLTNISLVKGLAYSIKSAYLKHFNGVYNVRIYSKLDATRVDEAIDSIFEQMDLLKTEPVSDDELELIKKRELYKFVNTFETNKSRVELLESIIDTGINPEMQYKRIEAVTAQDIMDAAIKYLPSSLDDDGYVLMLRDPLKDERKLNLI
ncbi:MAG: insulinase family protein [DPANN group archaeon]|nr:insulinase family protein [DPANN group archaeon]